MFILSSIIELAACIFLFHMLMLFTSLFLQRTVARFSWRVILLLTLYVSITLFPSSFISNTWLSVLAMTIQFATIIYCFAGNIFSKLAVLLGHTAFDIMITILGSSVFHLIFDIPEETLIQSGSLIRILFLSTTAMFEVVILLTARKYADIKVYFGIKETIITLLFTLNDALAFFLCYLILMSAEAEWIKITSVLIFFAFLSGTSIVLSLLIQINQQAKLLYTQQLISLQVEEQKKQLLKSQENEKQVRTLRHDMKRYLDSYRTMLINHKYEELLLELDAMLEERLYADTIFYTTNLLLNSILQRIADKCQIDQIVFAHSINVPDEYNDIEIMVLISNLLDNAYESELLQPIDQREIRVTISVIQQQLSIIVHNRITNSVLETNPDLVSHKTDASIHGYGIAGVKQLVLNRNGLYRFTEENGYFIAHILLSMPN